MEAAASNTIDNHSSGLQSDRDTIEAALETMPTPLFAVLDGGHFEDLEKELFQADIVGRSLFLEGGKADLRRDGPWLVSLHDTRVRGKIMDIAHQQPCAVFWSCQAGERVLWRHLRSINQVLVPDDRVPYNHGKSSHPVIYERVLFRHWDPNVLGGFLPLFSIEQLSRLLGPADGILLSVSDSGRFKRALRPTYLPKTPRGPLRIEPEQVEIVSQVKVRVMVGRVSEYLRSVAGEQTRSMSNDELAAFSHGSIREAMDLGVTSEGSHCRWAYMKLVSGGRISSSSSVIGAMRADDVDISPNDRVTILMQKIIQETRRL
ncbi:DUF4123 domain-containing protein [Agrobacterium vaccinii]|uniref:DUF4123 domain-containing protein n=1 Tax=Agrobacterium vaccinii TaxID=2735528 RepID=UPI001E453B23|nr:DUF4123 domain-containing protein [Agrobacterium vaccinii]UHS59996.1 DUF4123 domain-containing protein [Agrobacterium vaccinii]